MEIAYPFVIYKDSVANKFLGEKEPIIHINTLAQICYRAYSNESSLLNPLLIIMDPYTIDGVAESGIFKMEFDNNYVRKTNDLHSVYSNFGKKDFRLGIVYEANDSTIMEQFSKALLLHGELRDVIEKSVLNGKEVTIQWVTKGGN